MKNKDQYFNSVEVKRYKNLNMIEAHYFESFTATADEDVKSLLNFLQAYIRSPDDKLPDVTLTIKVDASTYIKNLTLTKADIHNCTVDILNESLSIVPILALSALHHTKRKFMLEEETQVIEVLNTKEHLLHRLCDLISMEHGERPKTAQEFTIDPESDSLRKDIA